MFAVDVNLGPHARVVSTLLTAPTWLARGPVIFTERCSVLQPWSFHASSYGDKFFTDNEDQPRQHA